LQKYTLGAGNSRSGEFGGGKFKIQSTHCLFRRQFVAVSKKLQLSAFPSNFFSAHDAPLHGIRRLWSIIDCEHVFVMTSQQVGGDSTWRHRPPTVWQWTLRRLCSRASRTSESTTHTPGGPLGQRWHQGWLQGPAPWP